MASGMEYAFLGFDDDQRKKLLAAVQALDTVQSIEVQAKQEDFVLVKIVYGVKKKQLVAIVEALNA